MQSLTFEDVFPIARDLARTKAKRFIGRCNFVPADLDDLESELLLSFYKAFTKFDAQRSSIRTFASRVMDKKLVSIVRRRLAKCREYLLETEPLDKVDKSGELNNKLSAPERQQFWLDVDRTLAPCSDKLRETASALCWDSLVELSRSLRLSRAAIYYRIERLRKEFNAAGIDHAYFGVER